jgi:Leucine-rich repeat (LRR) protein
LFDSKGGNGLKGELPVEICALSENLVTIDVSGNNLEGQIPRCLRDFDKLEGIQMSNNTFGGWIPTYLLSIPTLKTVDLSGNQISGKAANLFLFGGAATGLTNALLQNNLLDGDFPVEVEGYPNLSELRLEGNVVTGEVSNSTCSLQGTTFLATLSADCQEVTCDCCTECF